MGVALGTEMGVALGTEMGRPTIADKVKIALQLQKSDYQIINSPITYFC